MSIALLLMYRIKIHIYRISLLYLVVSLYHIDTNMLLAQITEDEVKLSGQYFWGEGYGESRDIALENSRKELIEKVVVLIQSTSELNESELNQNYSSAFMSSINTSSRLEVNNLENLPPIQRRNGTWKAVSYLNKIDFEQTLNEKEKSLKLRLNQLEKYDESDFNSAYEQYLSLYLETFYFPKTIFIEVENDSVVLRDYLYGKIQNWINNVEITDVKVRSLSNELNTENYYDLTFDHNNEPVENLSIGLQNNPNLIHQITNSFVSVFSYENPVSMIETINFVIKPILPNSFTQAEIEFLENNLPYRLYILQVNFSDIIDLNFDIDRINNQYYEFIPTVNNLNVYDLKWFLNGDEFSSKLKPTLKVDDLNNLLSNRITLQVNNDKNLEISKYVNGNSTLENNLNGYLHNLNARQKEIVKSLLTINDAEQLVIELNNLSNEYQLLVGRKSTMLDPLKSFIAIVDPNNKKVHKYLSPSHNAKRMIINDVYEIKNSDLADIYKGFGSIWFQFK